MPSCITCNLKIPQCLRVLLNMKFDVTRYWYQTSSHLQTLLLLPFSWLFRVCVAIRRALFQLGLLKTQRFNVPVIVVGNVTVGGTGKTPMVIWLAQWLLSLGYKPGIVSRGAGGKRQTQPYWVRSDSLVETVGDEAVLLAQATECPVVVGVNRAAVVQELLKQSNCNIVISDDGMQHYRLGRDIEIAMIDAARHLGNQHLLPAGPLREPVSRLSHVDFVVVNGKSDAAAFSSLATNLMTVALTQITSLNNSQLNFLLTAFPQKTIHAIAGIGHPDRFFTALTNAGFTVISHPFPDHHLYHPSDLNFNDDLPIIMTEKDAVKCKRFAKPNYWYATVSINVDESFQQTFLNKLKNMGGQSCQH